MHLERNLTRVKQPFDIWWIEKTAERENGDRRGNLKQYKQYIGQDKLGYAAVTNNPRILAVQTTESYILFILHEGELVICDQSFPSEIQDATRNRAYWCSRGRENSRGHS